MALAKAALTSAGVAQFQEFYTFYHPASGHVEARNDTLGKHLNSPNSQEKVEVEVEKKTL